MRKLAALKQRAHYSKKREILQRDKGIYHNTKDLPAYKNLRLREYPNSRFRTPWEKMLKSLT